MAALFGAFLDGKRLHLSSVKAIQGKIDTPGKG